MTFFQNLFDSEFRGSFPLGDNQYSLTFSIGPNVNTSSNMICWNPEPYDLSTYNTLKINFAIDPSKKLFNQISINVAGVSPATTTALEIVNILNATALFSDWFVASVSEAPTKNSVSCVRIRSKRKSTEIQVFITNAGAEQKLKFNLKAPVAELPTYYARDTIANIPNFRDGNGILTQLNPADATVDQPIITAAGFDYSAMKADWQLLGGRSSIHAFQKMIVDGSNRTTEIIEYPAGATAGYLARKTNYVYTGANTTPSQTTQIPYVLTTGDLITP
jgi:hypothetical protein